MMPYSTSEYRTNDLVFLRARRTDQAYDYVRLKLYDGSYLESYFAIPYRIKSIQVDWTKRIGRHDEPTRKTSAAHVIFERGQCDPNLRGKTERRQKLDVLRTGQTDVIPVYMIAGVELL